MAQRIQHRRGTAAQWAAANPTLAMGEWGYETDTGRVKIGDASTPWSLLPFAVTGGSVTQADPLRQFTAALAKASTTPVTVVVVGDSLSEDWQWVDAGTSESVGLRSWVRLLEVDLSERFHGGAVGVGWLPIRAGLGTNPGWDTVTGALIQTAGLGFFCVELEAGEYAENAEVCDGVDLYIDSVASTLTIHIDSVLVDTLTADADPQVWSSGALTAGSHTVKVTAVGGTAKVYGSYWYLGNRTSGIQVHNGGHSGAGPLNHSTIRGTLEHIALVQPDLVIVPIGAAAGANGGFDAGIAAYTTNITALLDTIATEAPLASIVHVAEHAFVTRAVTWPPFAAASRTLAVENGWGFADCYETIGYVGGDPYDLTISDQVHLNSRGQRVMADTILNAVVGPTTRLDGAVLTAPPGDTVDVHLASGTGPRLRLTTAFTAVGLYLRRAADTAERGVFSDTGAAWGDGTNALDAIISRVSAGILGVTGAFRFTEQSDPAAPAANTGVLYVRDNGAGKTELCVRFSSGAVQVIATQP